MLDEEERELLKLIKHYEERAEKYEYEYQMNGMASQERAWMRNQRMANNLRLALNAKKLHDKLCSLHDKVLLLDTSEETDKLAERVRYIQDKIMEGEL